jgi:DNA polymerase III subunit gamma/tau
MDKFIVSARKYRPQTFATVVGQDHITTTLKNAIKSHQLAHAFLFCGPRGVGKTTCARILAKTINCEHPTAEGEACDQCASCRSFNEGASINYFELDAASNNSVEDVRELVNQVRFVPQGARYKVYVIDEVHMLSQSAFNAFLKTLEEPPPYAIFILATTEKHKIIPTILSRCQIFDFKRITVKDTVAHLEEICEKEKISAERSALQVITQKSEGCMRDALSILDKIVSFTGGKLTYAQTLEHLNILDDEFYFSWLDSILQQDLPGALLRYDEINQKGFEGDIVLNGFSNFIRNLLVCKDEKAAALLEAIEAFHDRYLATAKNVSPSLLISALNILSEAELNYKAARNKRLHTEFTLVRLCYLQQALEITATENGIVKKKIAEAPIAFRTAAILPFAPNRITLPRKNVPAKLLIQEPAPAKKTEQAEFETHAENAGKTDTIQNPGNGKFTLDKIRNSFRQQAGNGYDRIAKPLHETGLQECWNEFTAKLRAENNSARHGFETARLLIREENRFEILVGDSFSKQCIEQNSNALMIFLKEKLQNFSVLFTILIDENLQTSKPADIPLSSKEQLQKMTEKYPLVVELKKRLGMELDY